MVARSGLFVAPVPGTPPVGTSPTDGRLVLGAIFGTKFQCLAGGTVLQNTSSMIIALAAGTVWGIPDPTNTGAVFLSPYDPVNLTLNAGPSTGFRYDIIQVKQNDYGNGDADSRIQVAVKTGAAGANPTPPTPDAGYQVHATITVPTNATSSSQCTVTYAANVNTNFAPPDLVSTTAARLALVTGAPGQQAAVTADATPANNGLYRWNGSQWVGFGGTNALFTMNPSGDVSVPNNGTNTTLTAVNVASTLAQNVEIILSASAGGAFNFAGGASIWLNGVQVGGFTRFGDAGNTSGSPEPITRVVKATLAPGTNLLAALAYNDPGSGGNITVRNTQVEVFQA